MAEKPILSLKNISKYYPGVRALDDVSVDFYEGEIHCIVGENGAGKSTMIKVISGAIEPDMGSIEFCGKTYNGMTPRLSRELGIEVIYQEFNLAEDLTVAENIFLGHEVRKHGLADLKTLNMKAKQLLEDMDIQLNTQSVVRDLSVSYMQFVEIAKSLSRDVKVLVMDEPTAPLTEDEVDKLLNLAVRLKKKGYTIIYISHRMNEIFRIGDRYTVLRDGKKIITEPLPAATIDRMISFMVGREMAISYPQRTHELGPVVFEAKHIYSEKVSDISFSVRAGEILGLGGLVGAGRTETIRAIFGADLMYHGETRLNGEPIRIRHPQDAIRAGMGFVTEDRKRQGLLLEETICQNISLTILKRLSRMLVVDRKKEKQVAEEQQEVLRIKAPNVEVLASSLSGGNQQKIVLAKWLAANCKVIFMDEPTRGVDVGAKLEIYRLMNELSQQGIAIVMVSSEMEELLGMSDRLLILHEGKQMKELQKEEFSQETVLQYASGLS